MEWFEYVFTAIISLGSGAVITYIFESRKHKRELEQARVDRILRPLREMEFPLRELKVNYEMPDQYNYLRFCSAFEQLDRRIDDALRGGLGYDIAKESKNLLDHLATLHTKYLEAKAVYHFKRSQIKSDDVDSLNRLFDEYRMQLFREEQIKNLVYSLVDELVGWLKKHA